MIVSNVFWAIKRNVQGTAYDWYSGTPSPFWCLWNERRHYLKKAEAMIALWTLRSKGEFVFLVKVTRKVKEKQA